MSAEGWLADQLPRVLAEDPFLRRFLRIFEEIGDDLRTEANGQEHYVDPSVAPTPMLPFLGSWVDLELPEQWAEDQQRQRAFLLEIGPNFKWRGTKKGTKEVLEALTGAAVDIVDRARIGPWQNVEPEDVSGEGEDEDLRIIPLDGARPTQMEPKPISITLHGTGGLLPTALLRWASQLVPASVNFDLTIPGEKGGMLTYQVRGLEVTRLERGPAEAEGGS